jgi:EAL domain-containing protein (putative c-di-GMP-specific phosphodiesterase class I)
MVRSIKDIGHVMGKQVIAKSVESDTAIQHLREIGVDYAQGYAVGAPRPIDEVASVSVADLLA